MSKAYFLDTKNERIQRKVFNGIVFLLSFFQFSATSGEDIISVLEEYHVIGDVIDPFQPKLDFELAYGGKPVAAATRLTLEATSKQPEIMLGDGSNHDDLFTLVMVDPDAPSPNNPIWREILHWIVTNIPSSFNSLVKDLESSSTVVTEYAGPAPIYGRHRYVFVLFKQNGLLHVEMPESRRNFSSKNFSRRYKLGNPVAANFFFAENQT